MLCITNATSVLRAGGGDKHNLISVDTWTKILQSTKFVFCSTPFLAFKNHSRGTLVIPEAGQSIHGLLYVSMPKLTKMIQECCHEGEEVSRKHILSIWASTPANNASGTNISQVVQPITSYLFFGLSSDLPWIKGYNNGDSEWMRYYVFRQHCRRWFVNRETETFHNAWRKIHRVIPG